MKEGVLDACYACMARDGIERITIEDVAREAGVARATVYRWFPGGRDEVIDATIARPTGLRLAFENPPQ